MSPGLRWMALWNRCAMGSIGTDFPGHLKWVLHVRPLYGLCEHVSSCHSRTLVTICLSMKKTDPGANWLWWLSMTNGGAVVQVLICFSRALMLSLFALWVLSSYVIRCYSGSNQIQPLGVQVEASWEGPCHRSIPSSSHAPLGPHRMSHQTTHRWLPPMLGLEVPWKAKSQTEASC